MNWDRIVVGFLDELEKVAAFNTSGLSPETVMEKSQPPPTMETVGFNKARDILGRASQMKTAASKEIQRALPNQPGVGKLIHQGDDSAPEQAKSVAGYGLAGLGTGAAVHKAYSTLPHAYDAIHKPGVSDGAKYLAGKSQNAIGRNLMLGGAAAGVAYGGYRAVKKHMAQPAQVKQGTITKLSTLTSPSMALKASKQVGKIKVAPSRTGPNITTQIRGQLVGRKGVT
jgi:hypothetical protein